MDCLQLEITQERDREIAWQAVCADSQRFVLDSQKRTDACIAALNLMNLINPNASSSGSPSRPSASSVSAVTMTVSEALEAIAVVESLSRQHRGSKVDPKAAVSTIVDVPSLRAFMKAAEDRINVLESTVKIETKKRQQEAEQRERLEAAR